MLIFSRAKRSIDNALSPLAVRYLAAAGGGLGASRSLEDNRAYNVVAAPTWSLGSAAIVNNGAFAFSAALIVMDPATEALRTFSVDPEMEVGSDG